MSKYEHYLQDRNIENDYIISIKFRYTLFALSKKNMVFSTNSQPEHSSQAKSNILLSFPTTTFTKIWTKDYKELKKN